MRSKRKKKPQLVTEGKSVIEHSRARRESGVNTRKHEETCRVQEGGLCGWSWTCEGQESQAQPEQSPPRLWACTIGGLGGSIRRKEQGPGEDWGMCTDEEADAVVQA